MISYLLWQHGGQPMWTLTSIGIGERSWVWHAVCNKNNNNKNTVRRTPSVSPGLLQVFPRTPWISRGLLKRPCISRDGVLGAVGAGWRDYPGGALLTSSLFVIWRLLISDHFLKCIMFRRIGGVGDRSATVDDGRWRSATVRETRAEKSALLGFHSEQLLHARLWSRTWSLWSTRQP